MAIISQKKKIDFHDIPVPVDTFWFKSTDVWTKQY